MRKVALVTAATAMLLIMATAASAQVCGDVNGNGVVNVVDPIYLVNYLQGEGPAPSNPIMADCDTRAGLTVGDIYRLVQYFLTPGAPAPDCNAWKWYSYNAAPNDTIFVPKMLNIPEAAQSVALPIAVSFQPNTVGYYLPLTVYGSGADQVFTIDSVHTEGVASGIFRFSNHYFSETLSLIGAEGYEDFAGVHQYHTVWFKRSQAGIGNIVMDPTDPSTALRFAILKDDGDLYVPTVVAAEYSSSFLEVSKSEMSFTANFGFPVPELTDSTKITATGLPINWHADVSDSWIKLGATDGTTPSTLIVWAEGPDLPAGNYTGKVSVRDVDNQYSPPVEVTVRLQQRAKMPSMDANCDGKFNVSDLGYLINYMFGIPPGPPPCDPCTGLPQAAPNGTAKAGSK